MNINLILVVLALIAIILVAVGNVDLYIIDDQNLLYWGIVDAYVVIIFAIVAYRLYHLQNTKK